VGVGGVCPALRGRNAFAPGPEIRIEIRSRSNDPDEMARKTKAYLAAGAVEVWVISESGTLNVHDADGLRSDSRYGVKLELPPPLPAK
jgi:Uma2 family endonuclease